MKTVDLPKTAADVIKLLDLARSDDLIVRLADGSEFLLIAVDEFDQKKKPQTPFFSCPADQQKFI